MERIYWNLRTGLAGGFFLMADKVPYILSIYQTVRGDRCDILDTDLNIIASKLKINYAKRKVKRILNENN